MPETEILYTLPSGSAVADELAWRVERLRETPAWRAYVEVRRRVLAMKTAERASVEAQGLGGSAEPSAYWREELHELEYLLDASPLVVDRLRRHTANVTGLWAYQYRASEGSARVLERRLRALDERVGGRLGVPEPEELGGFGHRIDGGLYNLDTLKFHEALAALELGGALRDLRALERPVVWEIGGGWGGFAHQVKTLLPGATYVVVDLPELLMLSATYLRALFPEARVAFVGGVDGSDAVDTDADFVFVSHHALEHPEVPPADLVASMVAFQEMTSAQVRRYADRAAEVRCPTLYSLGRARSPYNTELSGVPEILAERYELEEVSVLETDHTRPLPEGRLGRARAAAGLAAARAGLSAYDPYRHHLGRLRAPQIRD